MGTIIHRAIIVTGELPAQVQAARVHATLVFPPHMVTPIVQGTANGSMSFMVAPSGSKVGWSEDRDHKTGFEAFIAVINQGDVLVDAAMVAFGPDMEDGAEAANIELPVEG